MQKTVNEVKTPTKRSRWHSKKFRRNLRENIFLWITRIALGIVFAFPLYWAIITSLKTPDEVASPVLSLFVKNPTLANYRYVLSQRDLNTGQIQILKALSNTLLLTFVGGTLNIIVTALAGYSFAKLKFKGHKIIFKILIASMMIPGIITMFPSFIVISRIGLWNIFGVVIPGISSVFNIFFLRQFFMNLPDELGESAEVDGASEFRIFWNIYLPQVKPAIAAIAIFNFQGGWNNFLSPYIILSSDNLVLATYIKYFTGDTGQTLAASMLMTLPILILFIVFQKYFMQSIAITGVKE